MKYKVQDTDEIVDGEILEKLSKDEYKIKIKDNEYIVKILNMDSNVMEFVLNNEFHCVEITLQHNIHSAVKNVVAKPFSHLNTTLRCCITCSN